MRPVEASIHNKWPLTSLEISGLWDYHNVIPVDPKWLLTSTKNNRLLVLNCGTPAHSKYEILLIWDLSKPPFLRYQCLWGYHNMWSLLTPNDLWPPPKTIGLLYSYKVLVLNVVHLHTKYEICPSFPSWDIVFTRFSQFDPKWPLTSTKNNRLLVLNWYTYILNMRPVQDLPPCWDINSLQGCHSMWYTVHDPKYEIWPPPKTIPFL